MSHAWILDVLADLKTYAHRNALPALVQHLDACHLAAAVEVANTDARAESVVVRDAGATARDRREAAAG